MKKTTKVAAVTLAAALGCSVFAGCDLVSTNIDKDYAQVIAEVDISQSEDFAEGGKYAAYKDVVRPVEITKLEMVAYFVTTGYSAMQQNGWTYYDTFEMISEALCNRALYVQYAMTYFLANGDAEGKTYTMDGFHAAVAEADDDTQYALSSMGYFLTDEEKAHAEYNTRVMFNNTIDTQEEAIIAAEEGSASEETVRTLPTGVDTANEDYYDPAYKVYTGSNAAADCGSYETVEGSTPATRTRAYNTFLANLRSNNLIARNENVSDIGSLSYYSIELRNAYEDAIIAKLGEKFEQEAVATLSTAEGGSLVAKEYDTTLARQTLAFQNSESTFETALDGMSDDSFVLTAPAAGYGYVVNILIPFSTTQANELKNADADFGDPKGNKFAKRAELLEGVRGTDQRGSWITGATDYSFEGASVADKYTGGNAARSLLFFEDGISENARYERISNYLGKYTYNGTVNAAGDKATPSRIDIDAFIAEMEGYLGSDAAKGALADGESYKVSGARTGENYFDRAPSEYYKQDADGNTVVDYEKFVYYKGKVDFGEDGFDANRMFVKGSAENVVYSAVNELSFAYNTDTAGLNTYLGYAVTIGKTSYVSEFEYAAQMVCKEGAGSYAVVATDYGWHIIYCTFAYMEGDLTPFVYDAAQEDEEGTFSNLFYEAFRSQIVEQYSTRAQREAISTYDDGITLYKDRYADLSGLDTAD